MMTVSMKDKVYREVLSRYESELKHLKQRTTEVTDVLEDLRINGSAAQVLQGVELSGKRRGRKKVNLLAMSDLFEGETVVATGRRRGRPKLVKSVTDEADGNSDNQEPAIAKRRPGRPPLNKPAILQTADGEPIEKRRRGRPKLDKSAGNQTDEAKKIMTADGEIIEKRRPGRPKVKKDEPEVVLPKRPRGRQKGFRPQKKTA